MPFEDINFFKLVTNQVVFYLYKIFLINQFIVKI